MKQNGNPPLFLGYIRKSVLDADDESASPARQRAAIEKAISARYPGAAIEWYEDLNISGRYEANRPDWQRLLQDLENQGGNGIVVESIDRAYRNVKEFLSFYDNVLAPAGRTLISATQEIDMSTAQGRAMASLLMTFAEMESRIAGERFSATIRFRMRSEGRHYGGIPFGCERDEKSHHLIPSQAVYWYNPATGEARADEFPGAERRYYYDGLRAMYEYYAQGEASYTGTAVYLNATGWRFWTQKRDTPTEWNRQTVRSVLRRWQLYAGQLPAIRVGWRETIEGGHAPILPIELCEAVGATHGHRSKTYVTGHGNRSKHNYLLTGLLFCAACGQPMCGQANHARRYYYRHRHLKLGCGEIWIEAPLLEGQLIELLASYLPGLIEKLLAELQRAKQEAAAGSERARELEIAHLKMGRLVDLYTDGLITKEEFVQRRAETEAQIEELTRLYGPVLPDGLEEITGQLGELLGGLAEAKPALQKEMVHSILARIEVKGGRIVSLTPKEWLRELFECELWAGSSLNPQQTHSLMAALLDCG